jgi:hypothetical protein
MPSSMAVMYALIVPTVSAVVSEEQDASNSKIASTTPSRYV